MSKITFIKKKDRSLIKLQKERQYDMGMKINMWFTGTK